VPAKAPPLVAAPDLALGVVGYNERGAIRFAGKAAPGTSVRAQIDGSPVGETRADDAGRWTLTPDAPFAPGPHKLRLEQLDAAGVASLPVDAPIVRAPPAALAAPGSHVVVQPADELWAMARTAYGHGEWYLQIFNANRNQLKDPRLIYPGQVLTIPTPMPSPSSTSR
jgi:nucleoid-associated protein YgaU